MTHTENQVAKNRSPKIGRQKTGCQKTGRQKPAACHQNGRYNQRNG